MLRVNLQILAVGGLCTISTLAQAQSTPPLNCAIRPSQVIDLAAATVGIAETVPVRPGQQVAEGDLIVRLDTEIERLNAEIADLRSQAQGALDAAEARRRAATRKSEMMRRARAARAISQERLDDSVRELAVAVADVKRERENIALAEKEADRFRKEIERAEIRAPMDGIIGENLISVGEAAIQQTPVAQLFVTQPMRVEVFVPSALLSDVIERSSHAVLVSGSEVPVTFDYASPVADLSSDTVSVYFSLDDPSILPGLRCQYPR